MIRAKPQEYSIITTIPSELVYISHYYFENIMEKFSPEINLYKKSLKGYPNQEELR